MSPEAPAGLREKIVIAAVGPFSFAANNNVYKYDNTMLLFIRLYI